MKILLSRSGTAAPLLAALAAAGLAPGCASVTGTPLEPITIQTEDRFGGKVSGAECDLSNAKGRWTVFSPGSVTVTRSNDDMLITCSKDGMEDGVVALVSAVRPAMFGNVLAGGVVGAVIDHSSGAAYDYPQRVRVVMGITRVVRTEDR